MKIENTALTRLALAAAVCPTPIRTEIVIARAIVNPAIANPCDLLTPLGYYLPPAT